MLPRPPMVTKINHVAFKLLLAVGFAALLAGCKPPGPKALLDGKRLLENGRIPEAIERLKVATELLRTNAQAWNYLGVAYHQAGQWPNATNAYKRALLTSPDLMEARLNLGTLYLELGRASEAKSEFTAYTLSRPNDAEGFQRLASAEMQLREALLAELHARKAIQLDDANASGWNALGLIQLQRARPRDAAQSFGMALQKKSGFAPALLNLAIVNQQQLGDRATALKLYRQYLESKPRPADADSVAAIIRQLEAELAPARPVPVAPTPVVAPPVVPPATQVAVVKPALTNPVPPKPAPVPIAKPAPAESKSVVAPPPVRPAPTVVNLQPEPVIRTTPVAEAPVAVAQPRPAPRPVATVAVNPPPASAAAKEEQRGFLQSINPANLFRPSKQAVTPLPGAEVSTKPAPEVVEETKPEPLQPPAQPVTVSTGNFARYTYRGAGNMTPGDRAAAQRFAAKGAEAMATKRFLEAMTAFRSAAEADPSWFQAHLNHSAAALQGDRVVESLHAGETALALKPDSAEARYNFALALKRGNYVLDAALELERLLASNPDEADAHLVLGNIYAEQLRQPAKARAHYLKVLELKPKHPRATAIRFWLKANPA